jgi:hypothetical protein
MQTYVQSEFIKNKCTTKLINNEDYYGFFITSTDKNMKMSKSLLKYLKMSISDKE